MNLLWNADRVENLRDALMRHVRDQPLTIVQQFEETIGARCTEVLRTLAAKFGWVSIRKVN